MLQVNLCNNKKKLEQQLAALEWQLTQDTCDKDKEIHKYAIEQIKHKLKSM